MNETKDPNKEMASVLRRAVARKEERANNTVGLYALQRRGSKWSLPFVAMNDKVALEAMKDIAKTVKEVNNANLYRLGSYCILDGKLIKEKPVIVLG